MCVVRNHFLMDFENACLSVYTHPNFPKGKRRHEDPDWAELLQSQISKHSDLNWEQYVLWVENGGGDIWVTEPEPDEPLWP